MNNWLGIDYGTKRIGLAIGNDEVNVALPLGILKNTHKVLDELKDICKKKEITAIIIGESINAKGNRNDMAEEAEEWGKRLREALGEDIAIHFYDERYTSHQAHKLNPDYKGSVDDIAAMIMLQSYMDKLRG